MFIAPPAGPLPALRLGVPRGRRSPAEQAFSFVGPRRAFELKGFCLYRPFDRDDSPAQNLSDSGLPPPPLSPSVSDASVTPPQKPPPLPSPPLLPPHVSLCLCLPKRLLRSSPAAGHGNPLSLFGTLLPRLPRGCFIPKNSCLF